MDAVTVLACNAGSSSLKLSLFTQGTDGNDWAQQNESFSGEEAALTRAFADWLQHHPAPTAVLHRVVHAGRVSEHAEKIDQSVIDNIKHWQPLAPRHNGFTLELIALLRDHWPGAPQFAIYDAGLFADLPEVAARYALPEDLSPRWSLRRYGFHGLAHRSQWRQVQQLCISTPSSQPVSRVISVHLGSGCSVSAWRDGQVIDTSMGFTPLDGLVMARRGGSMDPGILLHLLQQEAWSAAELNELLNGASGLAALGGHGGDLRAIMADAEAGAPRATEAVRQFCYQVQKTIGSYMAILGGVDAISFGGGTGEHQPAIRAQILEGLQAFGIRLHQDSNQQARGSCRLDADDSTTALCLTPVNEMEEMLRQYVAYAGDG